MLGIFQNLSKIAKKTGPIAVGCKGYKNKRKP